MNRSEKGYFKKFAKRNASDDANSIKLFDAIEKQISAGKVYDENQIRKKFSGESFIKHLPVTKNHLYNSILKSLSQYYADQSVENRINEMISNAGILEKKTLFSQAIKLIEKAKQLALKNDLRASVLRCLIMENGLVKLHSSRGVLEKLNSLHIQEMEHYINSQSVCVYGWLSDKMVLLIEKETDYKNETIENEISAILESVHMKPENIPGNYLARLFYYHTFITYYVAKADYEKSYKYMKLQIESAESDEVKSQLYLRNYIFSLINFLFVCNILKKRDDLIITLDKLKLIRRANKKLSADLEIAIIVHTISIELSSALFTGEIELAIHTVKEAEYVLGKYKAEIDPSQRFILLYNSAYIYFLNGKMDKALVHINSLINDEELDEKTDMYAFARIFSLVIHFELGNIPLLEYAINSTYRFLKQRKRLYKIENIFLRFLKKLPAEIDETEWKKVFEELESHIHVISEDPKEKTAFDHFDFLSWIKSKLSKKTMAVELMKKIQNTRQK